MDTRTRIAYAGCYDNRMYAVDLDTGSHLWHRTYEEVEDDLYSSPALTEVGDIIFGANNRLVCLNAEGHERWSFAAPGRFEGTAALDHCLGIGVIGTEVGGTIYLFRTETGEILGEIPTNGFVVSCPSLSLDGFAFVGSNDGYVYGIDLHRARLAWQVKIGCEFRYTPFTTTPDGNALFVGVDEKLHCLDCSGRLLWALEVAGGFHSSPLITSSGDVVIGSHRNALHFYRW